MIAALFLATLLFLGAIAAHLAILGGCCAAVARNHTPIAKLTTSLIVLFSHLLVAACFAGGFWLGHRMGLGSFDKVPVMGWMDYFYFSLVNITTLGLGDIYPTQHLRVIAGIESLTGFVLISCSAQFFWIMLKQRNTH